MKKIFTGLFLFAIITNSLAQSLAINTDGSIASSTAMLDVKSTTKGFLPPRMTQVQRDAIAAPAEGLIVHCTDCSTIGPYTYNGSSWISMSYKTYKIGDAAQGGIVFWVDDTGQHGLIAATADQGSFIPWSIGTALCNKIRVDGIYVGSKNTDSIIVAHGTTGPYAALLCATYISNGYADWYLPSKYELNLLYLQKAVVGGFVNTSYWSSTETDISNANSQNFLNGTVSVFQKNNNLYVRAIRRF
jgi:hypothetical protein